MPVRVRMTVFKFFSHCASLKDILQNAESAFSLRDLGSFYIISYIGCENLYSLLGVNSFWMRSQNCEKRILTSSYLLST